MIKINLHGVLAFEFGKEFNVCAKNTFFALKALTCIKGNFLNRLKQLGERGFSYSIIVDGEWVFDKTNFNSLKEIKKLDIVPNICGAEIISALVVGLFAAFAAAGTGAAVSTVLAMTVLSIGLTYLSSILNKPKNNQSQNVNAQFVGGQTASSFTKSRSYAFSSVDNVAAQNVPIPIGYGRVLIGSKIIQTSIKSYPTDASIYEEFSQNKNPLSKLSLGFIS